MALALVVLVVSKHAPSSSVYDFKRIKYLDVGPQAQLPPPYAEDINALLTMVLSKIGPFRHSIAYAKRSA